MCFPLGQKTSSPGESDHQSIATGTSFRNGSVPWKRSSTQVQTEKPGETDGPKPEALEKRTGFCKHALHFVRESKHVAIHHNMYVFDEKYVEFAVISLLSHEKSPKKSRDFTDVWIHLSGAEAGIP